MFTKLLPLSLRMAISKHIQKIAEGTRQESYFRSHPSENAYCIKSEESRISRENGFPAPPQELMSGYGPDAETYLTYGKKDVSNLVEILSESGFPVTSAKRILEFGCAAGRMIRHFPQIAPESELWGVDVSAEHIRWCVRNLAPHIHFAATTLIPHLPFEDRFFDLIFCGSVFTHIEDLQETWLLELGRVLRPSGRLYLTIHDENTVQLLDTKYRDHWLSRAMREAPVYSSNKDKFDSIVIGRGIQSQVFYNSDYFRSVCPSIYRWVSLTKEAYGYQSAVVLEKHEPT
jgi:SAM-dependent methyltransferase